MSKMLKVVLVDDLRGGDELYWKGSIYKIHNCYSDDRHDLALRKCDNQHLYWLNRVYYNNSDHYYRVCNFSGDYIGKIVQWQFNIVKRKH